MNLLIYCLTDGMISCCQFNTAAEAIEAARTLIEVTDDNKLFSLKVEFNDFTSAVWNAHQQSEILKPN